MVRPLRIEFPGALYHVTSRGARREPIVGDDADRELLIHTQGAVVQRFKRGLRRLLSDGQPSSSGGEDGGHGQSRRHSRPIRPQRLAHHAQR